MRKKNREIKKKNIVWRKTKDMMLTLVDRVSSDECGVLGARGFDNHSGVLVNQFSIL